MLDGTHYFECKCGSSEHTLRFVLDKDPTDPGIHTEIYLNQWRPWWKQAWIGLKYMFGYPCRYGHWDCWILSDDDAKRLRDMCDEYLSRCSPMPGKED
jgi:hypothetical protein